MRNMSQWLNINERKKKLLEILKSRASEKEIAEIKRQYQVKNLEDINTKNISGIIGSLNN